MVDRWVGGLDGARCDAGGGGRGRGREVGLICR